MGNATEVVKNAVMEGMNGTGERPARNDATFEIKVDGKEEDKDKALPPYAPLHGATSFNEAEELQQVAEVGLAIRRLNWIFQDLVNNIMDDDEVSNKPAAINALVAEYSQRLQAVPQDAPKKGFLKQVKSFFGLKGDENEIDDEKARTGPAMKRVKNIDFPARDFAYVPDPQKPSTWKLRLTERPGKVTLRQLGRAASAMSTGGLRGNRVLVPKESVSSVKRRIRQEYRKLGVLEAKIPNSIKIDDAQPRQKSGFFVLKDKNDEYRWFSVYSNNYRDDDSPPDIIAGASHRTFVKAVDDGVFPMPELWLWHYEHPVGDADWLDYTDGGLAVASGTFRKGYEETAEKLEGYASLEVSHGMPTEYIVRDQDDPSIIWFHVTKEISPLPVGTAANKLTGFVVMKETEMPISDDKQNFLRNTLPEGLFDSLNSAVTEAEGKAAAEERESKEISDADDPTDVVDEKDAETPEYVTAPEVAEALGEVLGPLISGLTKGFQAQNERVASLEARVKELTVAQKTKEEEEVPAQLSLSALLSGQMDKSAEVGSDEVLTTPTETPVPSDGTGSSLIDGLIAGSQRR